jgi:hypothetical protein
MDNMNGLDPKYLALIQAGLGILAGNNGRQPAGAAIGQGLLGGVGAYQDSLAKNQQMAMQKQQFEWQKADHDLKQHKYAQETENNKMIYAALGITPEQPKTQEVGFTPANYSQQQPKALDRNSIQKLGLITSLNGGHGGDALMKYADAQKPNWVNVGGKFVNSNEYNGEIPISPAPMSESERTRMQYEGILPQENAPSPVTNPQPQQQMNSSLPPASQKKIAEAKALQDIQDNSPKAQAERAKLENENRLADEKRQRGLQGQKSQANLIIGKVDEALGKVNGWSTGFVGQKLSGLGGSDSYDLNKAVDTIKANLGFQELQAMRENSPTGGALGAIAVQELQALQSTIASLDTAQSQDQLKTNLAQIKTHYQNVIDTMDGKTPQGYGNVMKGNETMPQNAKPVPKSLIKGQKYKGWTYIGGNSAEERADPKNWTR